MSLSKSRFIEMFIEKRYPTASLDELSICGGEYGAQSSAIEYHPNRPRYVRITDINEDGSLNNDYASSANIKDDEQYRLKYGDFLFARMGATVGKTYAYTFGDQIYAGYLIRYRLNLEKILPEYLFAFTRLNCYWKWVSINQNGAAQPGINAKKYGSLYVPVPPIEEQKKFIELSQQIDKSKFLLQKILEKLELLKKSRFIEMFGNPNTNSLNLPEKPIKNVCQNLDYKREPITSSERVKGKYPYYGASGIVDWVDNFIFDDDLLLVSEDGENLSARVTPIAFSIKGKTWVNNHAHVLKFNDLYMQNYVEYFFNQLDLTSKITGTAQPKFNQKALNETMLPIPSIESLVHFKNLCNQIDKSKLVIQKSLEDLVGKS